jgi:hypothetical protein
LTDTLTLPPPPPAGLAAALGDDAEDVVDEEPVDVAGLADATQGTAKNPAPIPNATADAPTRPMYFAFPTMSSPPVVASTRR